MKIFLMRCSVVSVLESRDKMSQWLDSHAHIFCEDFEDRQEVILRAKEADFNKILVVCCTLDEAIEALKWAENEPMLDVAVGFHPSDVHRFTSEDWNKLEEIVNNPIVVAVGEIGLDYHWTPETEELQKETFIRQIEWANRLNKPIIVHSRDAINDTYNILKEHPCLKGGIIHCFSSSVEMAREFIKLGYMISLGGPVTFKNAKTPKEVAMDVPLDRLLIETDCPYLTPHPHRGKRNEPMYAAYTGKYIAELRGIDEEELKEAIQKNYNTLFSRD